MTTPRRVERIVGVFVLIPVLALTALIVISGRSKGWFETKLELEATFDEGMALRPGALVVMEGVRIGWVNSVQFDPENRVEVQMKIRKRFAAQIRSDSMATITKLNLLGEPVVVISKGSAGRPPVDDGVEIQTEPTREVHPQELRKLILDVIDLVGEVSSEKNSFGKFLRDNGKMYNDMDCMSTSGQRLIDAGNRLLKDAPPMPIELTKESVTNLYLNERLRKQVDELVAMARRMDEMMKKLRKGEGTIGKLLQDEEAYDELVGLLKEAKVLTADLQTTAKYLKEAAPGFPQLVETGEALMRRADTLLGQIEANPFLGGAAPKAKKAPPVQIEKRFEHYRPQPPANEEEKR